MSEINPNWIKSVIAATVQQCGGKVAENQLQHTCWFRVSATFRGRKPCLIHVTAAVIFDPSIPRTTNPDPRKFFIPDVIIDPQFLTRLHQTAKQVAQQASAMAQKSGAGFGVSFLEEPQGIKKYVTDHAVRKGDFFNFVGLAIEVPSMPGQKKTVTTLVREFQDLSKLFDPFMNVKLEVSS